MFTLRAPKDPLLSCCPDLGDRLRGVLSSALLLSEVFVGELIG